MTMVRQSTLRRRSRKVKSLSELHVSKAGHHDADVPKVSFVTKVGDLGCGVGYYK